MDRDAPSVLAKLFWAVALLGACLGLLIGVGGVAMANGAPQEAAASAMGSLIAIGPYVLARSVDALTRH